MEESRPKATSQRIEISRLRKLQLVGILCGFGAGTWLDWLLVIAATAIFCALAALARAPNLALNWPALVVLAVAMLAFLAAYGFALWKTTRFN